MAAILDMERGAFHPWERWGAQAWRDELAADDRFVITARDGDDRVMAAATFQCVGDTADLHRIMVAREHRGRGAAKQMMRAGMEWAGAVGATRMLLEVREDNDAALGLYEDFGFAPIARRENYYGNGVHALVLEVGLHEERDGRDEDGWN